MSFLLTIRKSMLFIGLLVLGVGTLAYADGWQPIKGEENLRSFMSDTTVERQLSDGSLNRGEYRADGTGTLYAWGESFTRNWEIKEGDQICVRGESIDECYRLEKSSTDPTLYRVTAVSTGMVSDIRLSADGAVATLKGSRGDVGNKGGAGKASATEMANKLANPTAALGSMANHITYTLFDGDLPDADQQDG